jgi:hypothetical protein
MATSGYKSISRIKRSKKHSPGWLVRVSFKGELHQKFFPNHDYPSPRAALRAALRWRNATEREIGKPRTDRTVVSVNPKNKTGVIGIRLTTKPSQRSGKGKRRSRVYDVTWCPEPGVMRRTSVSIEKYGKKEAFRRALAIRQKAELEMYGAIVAKPDGKTAKPKRRAAKPARRAAHKS